MAKKKIQKPKKKAPSKIEESTTPKKRFIDVFKAIIEDGERRTDEHIKNKKRDSRSK